MHSPTKRALEDFDNQHDFERLAADVLNGVGYDGVEPMAPGGGADAGTDIRFRDGDLPGVAFATLEKNVTAKFAKDLAKHADGEGVVAFFCNVTVSPRQKVAFARDAMAKGFMLEVFDLERLRSLLDTTLRDVRRRYLGIDDAVAERIRSELTKLVRFPAAIADDFKAPSKLEELLADQTPRRAFDLLLPLSDTDIKEVPAIGDQLLAHRSAFYAFRKEALALERDALAAIGGLVAVRFPAAWRLYWRYVIMRVAGLTRADVEARGSFLNYGMTWDDGERVLNELAAHTVIVARADDMFRLNRTMSDAVQRLVV